MKGMSSGPDPESFGYLHETEVFGRPDWMGGLRKAIAKPERREQAAPYYEMYQKYRQNGGHISYDDAMRFVECMYPLDPRNPSRPFAKALLKTIADDLGLKGEARERVRLYSALDTPLDRHYGVDAFVMYDDPIAGEIVVTVDETQQEHKKGDELKADVGMYDVVLDTKNAKGFEDSVLSWSEQIVGVIQRTKKDRMERKRTYH